MGSWRLYAILDKGLARGKDLAGLAEEVIEGGADAIQLRDKISSDSEFLKDARILREIARASGIPLIVNDRADIARAADADGVHVGQRDLSAEDSRRIIGEFKLVGVSCHSADEALRAQKDGADYIGWGPVFRTSSKPALKPIGAGIIKELAGNLKIPVVCIGGINAGNLKEVISSGAECAAIASGLMDSPSPRAMAREIKKIMERAYYDPAGICKE